METKTPSTKNKIIRSVVQLLAVLILIVYSIFRIGIPVVKAEPVYLDGNDGWIIFGCLAVALVIEAVKKFIKRKTENL